MDQFCFQYNSINPNAVRKDPPFPTEHYTCQTGISWPIFLCTHLDSHLQRCVSIWTHKLSRDMDFERDIDDYVVWDYIWASVLGRKEQEKTL